MTTIALAVADTRRARNTARRHDLLALACLGILVLALVSFGLMVGDTITPAGDVVRVLLGQDVPGASFVVGDLRMPRVLGGLLAGTAFGMSGALFQTMLRNALASPDLIGINSGASAAAVIAIGFFGACGISVFAAAVLGSSAAALLVWALAHQHGLSGLRFVLVGIAVGAALQAVIAYVITRTGVNQAQQAVVWMTGSLSSSLWDQLTPSAIALIVLIPLALLASRPLPFLCLGDDAATALGARPARAKLVLTLVAVALASVATAIAGPVSFVAFLACPIAARLTHRQGALLPAAALVGAAIVLGGDAVAQHALGRTVPVGVVTGAIGAPCLLWLLMRGRTRL